MEEAKHFIGNQWITTASHETIPVIDPSDGQVFAQLARGNAADIDRAVQAARHAYEGPWGHASAADLLSRCRHRAHTSGAEASGADRR